jgi:hypothetical protein
MRSRRRKRKKRKKRWRRRKNKKKKNKTYSQKSVQQILKTSCFISYVVQLVQNQ